MMASLKRHKAATHHLLNWIGKTWIVDCANYERQLLGYTRIKQARVTLLESVCSLGNHIERLAYNRNRTQQHVGRHQGVITSSAQAEVSRVIRHSLKLLMESF